MQYIPCNSALLAQKALFLPKKALFMPEDLQKKVRKWRQILIRDKIAYFRLNIFVRVQTFWRGPPVLPCNFCHPGKGNVVFLGKNSKKITFALAIAQIEVGPPFPNFDNLLFWHYFKVKNLSEFCAGKGVNLCNAQKPRRCVKSYWTNSLSNTPQMRG